MKTKEFLQSRQEVIRTAHGDKNTCYFMAIELLSTTYPKSCNLLFVSKFTIFTIILAVSFITIMADVSVREYLDAKNGIKAKTSVISSTSVDRKDPVKETPEEVSDVVSPAKEESEVKIDSGTETTVIYTAPPPSATVTAEKVKEAGFTGQFTEKHFNGKVFQLLDVTKIPVDAIGFYDISQDGATVVSVTEIALKDEIRALALYTLLQNKTKTYIDLTLNETNAYGDRSFYINHAKKPDEAFLTVKVGKMLYSFAYVKFYHPEIKKLIQLLTP